jgi:hypothetical protein
MRVNMRIRKLWLQSPLPVVTFDLSLGALSRTIYGTEKTSTPPEVETFPSVEPAGFFLVLCDQERHLSSVRVAR